MGSVERRLRRLEAETPVARTEEEIGARACERLSTEDLTTLEETCRRLLDLGDDWGALTEEERAAFELAWRRYEEAIGEARAGR
jgi:DNA-binding HxlR family transcriptional regulator